MSEQIMWRAVIAQAFSDMMTPDSNQQKRTLRARDEAKLWLTEPSEDLIEVCEYADMDAERVMEAAWDVLIHGGSPSSILSELPSLT